MPPFPPPIGQPVLADDCECQNCLDLRGSITPEQQAQFEANRAKLAAAQVALDDAAIHVVAEVPAADDQSAQIAQAEGLEPVQEAAAGPGLSEAELASIEYRQRFAFNAAIDRGSQTSRTQ